MNNRILNKLLYIFPVLIIMFIALLIMYPLRGSSVSATKRDLKIVTTIYPYYLITKEIVGKDQDVDTLIPQSASPHTYNLSPADIKKISTADLIIANGLYLEFNYADILKSLKDKVFFASDVVNLDIYKDNVGDADEAPKAKNPHIWLDPILVIDIANGIKNNVSSLDPEHKTYYEQNCAKFIRDLKALDAKIKSERSQFKEANIITFHNAFYYFLKRYNIQLIDVIEPSPGKEATPRQLVSLGDKIKNYHIKALYKEPQLNPHSAEMLAKEFNLQVLTLDPEGKTLNPTTIIELIDKNWEIMKKGFTK